jgi:hypothetical protein
MTKNSNTILSVFKENFESKQFDQALLVLQENRDSFDSAVFYYNLGSVYLAKDELVLARVNLEKAIDLGIESNQTLKTLTVVKEKMGVNSLEKPSSRLEAVQGGLAQTGMDVFLSVSLVLVIFAVIKKMGPLLKALCIVTAFLPLIYFFVTVKGHERFIATEETKVLRGPSNMFEQVQEVPKGMVFIIKDRLDDWVRVEYPESHQGWIYTEGIEKL